MTRTGGSPDSGRSDSAQDMNDVKGAILQTVGEPIGATVNAAAVTGAPAAVRVTGVHKSYGARVVRRTAWTSRSAGRVLHDARPLGVGQDDPPAGDRRDSNGPTAAVELGGRE